MSERLIGKVVFYAPSKQYGFVRPDGTEMGQDVFFHVTQYDYDGDPALDTRVAFLVEEDPRPAGPAAGKGCHPYRIIRGRF